MICGFGIVALNQLRLAKHINKNALALIYLAMLVNNALRTYF